MVSSADKRRDLRFVVVSLDSLGASTTFFKEFGPRGADVLVEPSQRTYRALRLNRVPNVVVLDDHGFVQSSWVGRLSSERLVEIARALGLH